MSELKKKLAASKTLYISHVDALQNVVRLHKANTDASLEEMSSQASEDVRSIEEVSLKILKNANMLCLSCWLSFVIIYLYVLNHATVK